MTYALAATPMIAKVAEWRTYCAAGGPQGLNVDHYAVHFYGVFVVNTQ
jgi:hypothetical protein